mmetsp:Transcript_893/g.2559  ORF Transcript_893/g.2559 Transcript_893/m.2559 type:complete len:231 (-) Transcript_893:3383-4075(-)
MALGQGTQVILMRSRPHPAGQVVFLVQQRLGLLSERPHCRTDRLVEIHDLLQWHDSLRHVLFVRSALLPRIASTAHPHLTASRRRRRVSRQRTLLLLPRQPHMHHDLLQQRISNASFHLLRKPKPLCCVQSTKQPLEHPRHVRHRYAAHELHHQIRLLLYRELVPQQRQQLLLLLVQVFPKRRVDLLDLPCEPMHKGLDIFRLAITSAGNTAGNTAGIRAADVPNVARLR